MLMNVWFHFQLLLPTKARSDKTINDCTIFCD